MMVQELRTCRPYSRAKACIGGPQGRTTLRRSWNVEKEKANHLGKVRFMYIDIEFYTSYCSSEHSTLPP